MHYVQLIGLLMNDHLKEHLIWLLEECFKLCNMLPAIPYDLNSLREKIFNIELAREINALNAMIRGPSFEEDFKARCRWRTNTPEENISFYEMPESITNKLYWEIAELVFEPVSMAEMLPIILGNEKMSYLSVSISETLPPEALLVPPKERYKYLKPILGMVPHLKELTQAPRIDLFTHYVISGDKVFDVDEITKYSLYFHAKLQKLLTETDPELAKKLYSHNESFCSLSQDILLLNKEMTPKKALEQLLQGLTLGETRITGATYASKISENTVGQFSSYFNALSFEKQEQLKTLQGDHISLKEIIDKHLAKADQCVEKTAYFLNTIIQKNSNHPLFNSPAEITQEQLQNLEHKYRCIQGKKTLESKKGGQFRLEISIQLTKNALEDIYLETIEDLITLLLNFPPEFYSTFWEHVSMDEPNEHLEELADLINNGFFNHEQKQALGKAVYNHYRRLIHTEHPLFWALKLNDGLLLQEVLSNCPEHQKLQFLQTTDAINTPLLHKASQKPKALQIILELLSETQRLEALQLADASACTVMMELIHSPESLNVALQLLTVEQRIAVVLMTKQSGFTLLHHSIKSFEAVKAILECLPAEQRLVAIQSKDITGSTALHYASHEVIKTILSFVPEEKRLELIKTTDRYGATILHNIKEFPFESLTAILECLPMKQRLIAVQLADESGLLCRAVIDLETLEEILELFPVEDRACIGIKTLKSLPREQILLAIQLENKYRDTVLHSVACDPKLLEDILRLLLKEQRIAAVLMTDQAGNTILHTAAFNFESLKIILNLLPKEQRLAAVLITNQCGNTVLHSASDHPQSLRTILEFLSKNGRITAIQMANEDGNTVLHYAADNPEALKEILLFLPENQRFSALCTVNEEGNTVLHYAASNPQSLKVILGLLPEDQRLRFLRTLAIPSQAIWSYLAVNDITVFSSEEGFQDSFSPDFIKIAHFLADKTINQDSNYHFFKGDKEADRLVTAMNQCNSFDEIKNYLIHYVSTEHHSLLSKQLFNLFGLVLHTKEDIKALKQRWGVQELLSELTVREDEEMDLFDVVSAQALIRF